MKAVGKEVQREERRSVHSVVSIGRIRTRLDWTHNDQDCRDQ
jgi:hypothetical protein